MSVQERAGVRVMLRLDDDELVRLEQELRGGTQTTTMTRTLARVLSSCKNSQSFRHLLYANVLKGEG